MQTSTEPMITPLAARLREARESVRPALTLAAVAVEVGISPQAVHKWETGANTPSSKYWGKLERLYGRPHQWLIFGEERESCSDDLRREVADLRERVQQAISCLRSTTSAKARDKDNLVTAAITILESIATCQR